MAITSPLGVQSIGASVRSLGIAVTRVKRSAITSSNILMNRTKVKRSSIFEGRRLFQRKKESIRRKDQENIIELSTLTTPIKRGTAAIARSTQGFLGRVLEFTATLLTGWLLYNLPTLIAMTKELMGRITRMVEILKGFVGNLGNIMTGFGNVLGAVFQNVTSFDFLDTSKRVETAMKGLNNTFDDMGAQIDEGMRLLTTSLGEGLVTGENAPPTGTQYPAQQPETTYEGPGGPETTAGGKVVTPQSVYSYLRQLGVPHIHAVGILANIKGESGFRIDADETGKGTAGIGLFQYTFPSRKQRFLQAVPDWRTNWRGQVKYAIKNDENTPIYLRKQFRTPEEAADDFMRNWENPAKRVYRERRRKHNDFIKSFKPGGIEKPQISTPTPTPAPPAPSQSLLPKLPPTDTLGGGVQRYGAARRGGRKHAGTDFDISGNQQFYSRIGGIVTKVDYDPRPKGYGHYIDIYNSQLGVYERIAESAKVIVKKGQTIQPGQAVVQGEGPTGVIHYEIRRNPGYGFQGTVDPLQFLANTKPISTPAQIAAPPQQRRQQLPGQITPERQGPQIVLIDDVQPQQLPMPMSGGGGGGIIPIVINPLNRYITNKLLLDLAYT